MRIFTFLLLICLLSNCTRLTQKNITLYVSNINEREKNINLMVYINDSLYIKNDFNYSTITPNYDAFVYKLINGAYSLKVLKNGVNIYTDSIILKKDMFIYLSYGEGLNGEGKIFLKKTTVNYILH